MTFNEFASERAYKGSKSYAGGLGGKINEIKNYSNFSVSSQQNYNGPCLPDLKAAFWGLWADRLSRCVGGALFHHGSGTPVPDAIPPSNSL